MDVEKFNVLAELVREAKAEDQRLLEESNLAQTRWKNANARLTERMKVFDDFVASQKSEAIALRKDDDRCQVSHGASNAACCANRTKKGSQSAATSTDEEVA